MTTTMSNRTFGVEIECVGKTMEQAAAALNAAGVVTRIESYGHSTPSTWKIVSDSTVTDAHSNGFELVSPILRGQAGLDQVAKVSAALIAAGVKVNRTCGFHVHVGANDLNTATLVNLVKRYSEHESTIDSFMPKSRRGTENRFCQRMSGIAATLVSRSFASVRALTNYVSGSFDRYYKLNLAAFLRHGTVEFRQHSGTIDARKMTSWILFCLNFVDASIVGTATPVAPTAGLRQNAMAKKFQILAEQLDARNDQWNYVTAQRLAEVMGVEQSTVANYISVFRSRYPAADIQARRGYGYYNPGRSLVAMLAATPLSATSVSAPAPTAIPTPAPVRDPNSLFDGLSSEVVSYFQERIQDFATA